LLVDRHARFAIWGSAGHAKVLSDVIELYGATVAVVFDNNPAAKMSVAGAPLYIGSEGFKAWCASVDRVSTTAAAVAIGGARGADRRELAALLRAVGLALPPLVHPSAVVSATARIADGCHVLARAVIAADATLGEMCIVNNSANVDHECRLGPGVHIAPGAILCGCVEVGANAMIGAGAVVLPRIRIGIGAIVGAGAVVTRDVDDGVTVVGNPARPLRRRSAAS
jgi:sugar O-acyltransferase (sialic acid O-acetyltransferase NeuD family)